MVRDVSTPARRPRRGLLRGVLRVLTSAPAVGALYMLAVAIPKTTGGGRGEVDRAIGGTGNVIGSTIAAHYVGAVAEFVAELSLFALVVGAAIGIVAGSLVSVAVRGRVDRA